MLFLNVDYDALHFNTGRQKSIFSKYSLGTEGGVTKKSICTLLIMLKINAGRPLNSIILDQLANSSC